MDDIQSWWEVPSIAHFCSLFRVAFNLLDFDIEELEEALLTDGAEDSGSSLLQELMVRLLAGCVPSAQGCISIFNYQMFLRRLFRQKCQEYGRDNPFNTDMDFQFLPLRSKVEILHALCDFRLDADDVQDLLKNLESDSLRVEPLGHDESNSAYWYFYGTRLYREDYPKAKKGAQERKRKIRDDKRKRTRRKKKKGAATADEEEEEEELASDGENEDACLKSRTGAGVRWQVVCFSEGDWEALTERLHGSTSPPERALHRTLAEDFLPEIPRLFAEKERLQRKRMQESQPRRTSGRIEKLRKQQQREAALMEEEERNISRGNAVAKINEDSLGDTYNEKTVGSGGDDEDDLDDSKEQETKRLVEEEEKERLFQCYLAREERLTRAFLRSLSTVQGERIILGSNLREESSSESSLEDVSESKRRKSPRVKRRDKHKGRRRGAAGGNRSEGSKDGLPVGRQTNNSLSSATGPIIIQTSRRKLKTSQVRFRQSDEDLQTGLHKILERVKSHEDAWPFADPVDEEWAPRYYAVVRKPMHLRRMEEKLEAGEYLSFSHFKADFMLIVDNCRKYNGSDNEYTEMVENLREVFQRAADRYLESDLSSDEDVAVEFPPPAGAVPGSLPGAEGGAVGGEEILPDRVKKEEPEEAVEQEEDLPAKEEISEGRRRRKRLRGGNSWKEGESKRRLEEESANEEENVKVEEKVFAKEKDAERKEEKKEEKRRQEKKKEEKNEERKEERKEEKKRKEEERRKEEEVEREKEKRGKAEKEGKGKVEEVEEKEVEEKEKVDERREEGEEERFGSHRKRRKKLSDDDGNEKKRKGQSGRERARRGVETEEEVLEEKKVLPESAPLTEEDDDEGNTSGSRKKDSTTSSKKNKSKPKKQAVVRNAAAIDALAEATEQTLKDINKWLDDTPRFSEFSSASNSPSHLLSAEEFDAVGKGIESEYRRSLRMCDASLGELQQKEHGKKETGQMGDKKGVRVDKRKPSQGSGPVGAVPGPKRTIIERLQPGKSKGNLLKQGRSNSDVDSGASGVGGVMGVGNVTDEPSKKPGEATPKLSLGSVLRGDIAFGEVAKKESEEGVDEEEEEKILQVGSNVKKEKKQEEEKKKVEVEEKVEEEKNVRKKIGSATPNLSAWFKAFGAPRGQGQRKKGPEEGKAGTPQDEVEKTITTDDTKPLAEEAKKAPPEDDPATAGKVDAEPLSPSPSGTPHSNSGRQRHVSTGSSNVSDLSSAFSPDVVDPALSPRLVELPSHSPSASIPPPLPSTFSPVNGTIRVGFYQDTSQKSGGSVGSNGGVEEGLPSPTHAGSSSLSLSQSSVPMQSSDMQFYDTSKPLTDQYREVAARVHHHQHPPSAPTPPPASPSPPPPPSVSPPRPMPYPTTTPSVIFSTGSSRVTSPTYLSPVVYPPPASTSVTAYAPSTTTTTTSFTTSDSGAATTFPVKKRLYASASVSSAGSAPLAEGAVSSVLVAPTCTSPVGRSYHSPEPQVALVQRTAPLVLPPSSPPYDCSAQGSVPGYPHAHLQPPQSKLGFQRLPIYHHHPELTQLHPQHPEKPEPLRSVLHHPPHSHPSHSPHASEVQPSSPPRPIDPMIPYPVEHQRRVLDLTGSTSAIQPAPPPPVRTKSKTSRKTKAVRQQQQRQEQQPSETLVGPASGSGFQQFTRKSPEPMAAGLQQPQHAPSSAFEFAGSLTLYGRDDKDFQHHYLRAPALPPPSTGYYVDPGSMVKSPPPSPHQQPQQQHSQPLPQGCPPQATVGSALPSYPFPISSHYPHYHHPHHHHHLEAVPPPKSQYLPSSPPTPSSTASPTTAPSPSPTTSASPIAAPSIPASLLSSAPPTFHSPLPPTLPAHRTFCASGNSRASGSRILAFPQGQQREGGSIVAAGAPFAVDAAHTSPLYQQYHHHTHPHHLHPPPHHIPQEELLLRGAAPPLAPAYPSGYQHAFDAINRPWH